MDAMKPQQKHGGGARYTAAASPKRLHKAKPPANPAAIPAELRTLRRWVVWDYIDYGDGKKPRKVPVTPGKNYGLSWNVSTAWRSFDEVMREANERGGLGVGFVFDEGDRLNAVDLDDAFTDGGELKPWAQEIANRYSHTYGERTPSGCGLHFIGEGERVQGDKQYEIVPDIDAIERYSQDRFFTFTGDVIQAKPVSDVREAMAWLADTYFGGEAAAVRTPSTATPSDDPEFDSELARVCVEHLSTSRACNAEDWRRVGYAIKSTSESLLPLWLEFSRRWPDCSDEECKDRWNRFRPNSTVGTLVQMATEDCGRSAIQLRDLARERLGREPWKPQKQTRHKLGIAQADAAGGMAAPAAALASLPVAGDGGCTDLSRPQTWEEVHLARRLAKQIRGRLVYVRERGMWLAFNGKRWLERADHITVQECKRLHDELWRELGELPAEERTAAAVRFVQSTGTKRRIDAIIGLARSEPGINVSQADFDTHPWLLNVENGVLDLRSGELLPHDPALRLTQLAAVTYDPEAKSELWERFMREVTSGDEQIENFLQQSFGLALTGDVSDEVLICHNGGGCNGKSTALEAVGKMLGDYAAVAPPGLFMARSFDSHPTEIAALHGKRFVTAIEQEANRALRESLVKSLTGGDTIRTRRMREDFWEMRPTWHIHVAYNRAPRLTGTDDGIRRRLRVVPWAASFKDRPDLTIKERLMGESERSGILTWCLEGLRRRLAVGRLESPAAVMIATDEYLDDEDLVGRFIADRCVEGARVETEIRSALAAFRAWMIEDGTPRHVIDGYTVNVLGRELARRGFPKRRPDSGPHRKRTVYVGLSVSSECEYAQPGEEWSSPFPD